MSPWKLAKESEHSNQVALFCWAAKAQRIGFQRAWVEHEYNITNLPARLPGEPVMLDAIPELRYLHAIPNGGSRGDTAKSRAIEGGKMKAEGVKPGIMDICWPLSRKPYCGLYVEMKSVKGRLSEEQQDFGDFVYSQGFGVAVAYNWIAAAVFIQDYYQGTFKS